MNIWDLTPLTIINDSLAVSVIVLFILSFFIGVIASMFGIGGGFFFTPFYHSIIQLPAQIAVATSLGQIPFISLSATLRYRKIIAYKFAGLFLIFALPASQITSYFVGHFKSMSWAKEIIYKHLTIPDLIVLIFYSITILFLGSYALFNKKKNDLEKIELEEVNENPQKYHPQLTKDNLLITILAGVLFGFLSALLGIGGGFITVPFFIYILKMPVKLAVGTSLFVVVINSSITSLHYLYLQQIYWGITLIAAFGGSIGASVGSKFAIQTDPVFLQKLFGGFQILIVIVYLWLELF